MVHSVSPDVATAVAELLESALADHPAAERASVVESIAELVEGAARSERERCVEACRRRSLLWRNTALADSGIPAAREEARSRANEAAYLADLLEQGGAIPSSGDESGGPDA